MASFGNHCFVQTNTTSNFNTVLKVMQPQTIDASSYPISDVVTWSFFIGRYHLYQGDYANAVPLLSRAFACCPKAYKRNKQLILTYLIPANAMVGTYPKKTLLEQYQLMEYYELIEGVKRGNYAQYQKGLDSFERAFDRGVYLPLRRLTTVLFRNLFKKTALVYASTIGTEKAKTQLPLTAFNAALQLSGYPITPEETACITTNLIATKKVRGYISYEHQLVVLAPGAGAFPSLVSK